MLNIFRKEPANYTFDWLFTALKKSFENFARFIDSALQNLIRFLQLVLLKIMYFRVLKIWKIGREIKFYTHFELSNLMSIQTFKLAKSFFNRHTIIPSLAVISFSRPISFMFYFTPQSLNFKLSGVFSIFPHGTFYYRLFNFFILWTRWFLEEVKYLKNPIIFTIYILKLQDFTFSGYF